MTADFVTNVVAQCPLMQEWGLLPSVMLSAIVQREASPATLEERHVGRGLVNRGLKPSEACWEVKASFALEEVAALAPDGFLQKWSGLVAGYPADLRVGWKTKDGNETLGAFRGVHMPKPGDATIKGPRPA